MGSLPAWATSVLLSTSGSWIQLGNGKFADESRKMAVPSAPEGVHNKNFSMVFGMSGMGLFFFSQDVFMECSFL